MPLNKQELAYLIWILHFRNQFTLKDISKILKIPYWKAKDFASVFENDRLLKIKDYRISLDLYKKEFIQYECDQKRLESLYWRFLAWTRLWIPLSKPSEPSRPTLDLTKSPELQQCYDQCVKRLNRIRKGKSTLTLKQIKSKPDPFDLIDSLLNQMLINPKDR